MAWQWLEWDTRHFEVPIARIDVAGDQAALAADVAAARDAGVHLAYVFAGAPGAAAGQWARGLGAVCMDVKTTWVAPTSALRAPPGEATPTLESLRGDLPVTPAVRALALAAGEHSRFRVDRRLPPRAFTQLYEAWIARSIQGEIAAQVYCVGPRAAPQGLVTVGDKEGVADIGLLAVAEQSRGRGVGRALVQAAAGWAHAAGLTRSQVVTQGANLPACRLYERCGYVVGTQQEVLHLWLSEPL